MKNITKIISLSALMLLLTFWTSCDSQICTSSFDFVQIQALDQNEEPVELDSFEIIDMRTEKTIDPCDFDDPNPCPGGSPMGSPELGGYTIFHDGIRDMIIGDRIGIRVIGQKGDRQFQEDFLIGNDGCHVYKMEGPESVTLQD